MDAADFDVIIAGAGVVGRYAQASVKAPKANGQNQKGFSPPPCQALETFQPPALARDADQNPGLAEETRSARPPR